MLPAKREKVNPTVKDLIIQSKEAIAESLPKHLDVDRFARIAITTTKLTPALLKCNPYSLVGALLQCSVLGLEPTGQTGEAYLIPYGSECTLVIGYRGMMKLARQSGEITNIYARIVYENEPFHLTYGLTPDIKHEPKSPTDRGKAIGAYAVAIFKDDSHAFEFMFAEEIEKIKKSSKSANSKSSPWQQFPEAMWKKTVIRQLCKFLPLSAEKSETVSKAVTLDEMTESNKRIPNLVFDHMNEESDLPPIDATAEDAEKEKQTKTSSNQKQKKEKPETNKKSKNDSSENEDDEIAKLISEMGDNIGTTEIDPKTLHDRVVICSGCGKQGNIKKGDFKIFEGEDNEHVACYCDCGAATNVKLMPVN